MPSESTSPVPGKSPVISMKAEVSIPLSRDAFVFRLPLLAPRARRVGVRRVTNQGTGTEP